VRSWRFLWLRQGQHRVIVILMKFDGIRVVYDGIESRCLKLKASHVLSIAKQRRETSHVKFLTQKQSQSHFPLPFLYLQISSRHLYISKIMSADFMNMLKNVASQPRSGRYANNFFQVTVTDHVPQALSTTSGTPTISSLEWMPWSCAASPHNRP